MRSIEQALAALGATGAILTPRESESLARDGYTVLRGLVAADRLPFLRRRFEDAVKPSEQWPYPRTTGLRFAMLDGDEAFLDLCLSPRILAGVYQLFRRRFFLAAFEGRAPCEGGGQQNLHRDCLEPMGETHTVSLLIYLDNFDAGNGATRLIPASHLGEEPLAESDPREIFITGAAGDALLFNARLIHAGSRNISGAERRTVIASYQGYEQYADRFFKLKMPPGTSDAARYVIGE